MKEETFYECKLTDLRKLFQGVKGKTKVFIHGLNDINARYTEDGRIELSDARFTETTQDPNSGVKKTTESVKKEADKILNNSDQAKLQKPTGLFVGAGNARNNAVLDHVQRHEASKVLDSKYAIPNVPVQKLEEEKRYDAIQHCVDAAERRKRVMNDAKEQPGLSIRDLYPTGLANIRPDDFYSDLMVTLVNHGLNVQAACSILIERKVWRKKFKKSLKIWKRRKRSRKFSQKISNPELPNNPGMCSIHIPYVGYVASSPFEFVLPSTREKFAKACKNFYEANGFLIYGIKINENDIEIIVSRRNIAERTMDIMDYYDDEA